MYAPTWQHRFVKREFWDFAVRKPYVTLAFLQPSSHIVKRIRLLYRSSMSEFVSNIYRFPTPSKCDGRVPSQQGTPSTYRKLGVVYWRNSPLPCGKRGGGGGEGRRLKNSTYQLFWAQIHSDTLNCLFPSTAFLLRTQLFLNSLPANIHSKNRYFEEQIHWVPLHLLLNSWSPLLKTTSGKSCILDPIPGILMEDCYTILLPVIVSNHCGQTSKSLFLFFIAGISFTS